MQFNLRTIRYTEADLHKLANSNDYITFAFTLTDQFGDNGIISTIILKKEDGPCLFIETWIMSCRVLKRGMENFVLDTIINVAKENGFTCIKGEYLPTAKNDLVRDHFNKLGFYEEDNFWYLNIGDYQSNEYYISKSN